MNDEEREIHGLILDKVNILDKKIDKLADSLSGRLFSLESTQNKVIGTLMFLTVCIPMLIAVFAI